MREALARSYCGRPDDAADIYERLAGATGGARVYGLCGLTLMLPLIGRTDDAVKIAEDTRTAARGHGNPFFTAWALLAYGLAVADLDPSRALDALNEGIEYARQNNIVYFQATITREAARVEATHGDQLKALELFVQAIDALHQAGSLAHLAIAFGFLAVFFGQLGEPETVATLYGATTGQRSIAVVVKLPSVIDTTRTALGAETFERCFAAGAAMEPAEAVRYARNRIHDIRHILDS